MIKLQDMTKAQKQKAFLVVGGVVMALFVLKQFVVGPMISSRSKARTDYAELKAKLEQANAAVMDETETDRKLNESLMELQRAQRECIPSSDNLLAWATKTIYGHARAAGVDVESVAETEMDVSEFMSKNQARYAFKPFGVRITAQCGVAQLIRFLAMMEESNHYLCVSGIQVSAQSASPERHTVSLVVEWPSWKDPVQGNAYASEEKDDDHA